MDIGGRRSSAFMNSSSSGQNSTIVLYSESYSVSMAKIVTVLLLGIIINSLNGTLIHTFRNHQVFYLNPRYILFIHLVVNDIIQLTTSISLFVFTYVFTRINTIFCSFILGFAILTTLNSPLNLAVMAVECYVAVCFPLRHSQWCTVKMIYILIACMWGLSILSILPDIFFLAATNPAMFLSIVVCEQMYFFKNSVLIKKKEVTFTMYLVGVWLVLIYTYVHIFIAARSAKTTNDNAKKAQNTILLHSFQLLLCMLTYIFPTIQEIIFVSYPEIFINFMFVSYILLNILPRLLSPMVYGLRDKTFQQHLKKYLLRCSTVKVVKKAVSVSVERK